MGKKYESIVEEVKEVIQHIKPSDRETVQNEFVTELCKRPLVMAYLNHYYDDLNFTIGDSLRDPWTYWKDKHDLIDSRIYEDMTYSTAVAIRPFLTRPDRSNADINLYVDYLKRVLNEIPPSDLITVISQVVRQLPNHGDLWLHLNHNWMDCLNVCIEILRVPIFEWKEKHGLSQISLLPNQRSKENEFDDLFYGIYCEVEKLVG